MGRGCRKGGQNLNAASEDLGHNRTYKRCFTKIFGAQVTLLRAYKWERDAQHHSQRMPPQLCQHEGSTTSVRDPNSSTNSPREWEIRIYRTQQRRLLLEDSTVVADKLHERSNVWGRQLRPRRERARLIPWPLTKLVHGHISETSGDSQEHHGGGTLHRASTLLGRASPS